MPSSSNRHKPEKDKQKKKGEEKKGEKGSRQHSTRAKHNSAPAAHGRVTRRQSTEGTAQVISKLLLSKVAESLSSTPKKPRKTRSDDVRKPPKGRKRESKREKETRSKEIWYAPP
jgi:hypothetical protein